MASGWHTAVVKIVVGIALCTLVGSAPAWSQTTVEPRARQIFSKAATRYGSARTFRLSWHDAAKEQSEKGGDQMAYVRGSVAFDRKGLLRWYSTAQSLRYSLVVVDGKSTSLLLSEMANLRPNPSYERQSVRGRRTALDQLSKRGEWFPTLAQWLQGISPLSRGSVRKIANIATYSAKVLPTTRFLGKPCEIVRININYRDKKFLQETYWFQKASGQLVRIQRKKSILSSGESDIRIESQQFNPKLPTTTFRFVAPKKATLVAGK